LGKPDTQDAGNCEENSNGCDRFVIWVRHTLCGIFAVGGSMMNCNHTKFYDCRLEQADDGTFLRCTHCGVRVWELRPYTQAQKDAALDKLFQTIRLHLDIGSSDKEAMTTTPYDG